VDRARAAPENDPLSAIDTKTSSWRSSISLKMIGDILPFALRYWGDL
jgi:hypothetical protein